MLLGAEVEQPGQDRNDEDRQHREEQRPHASEVDDRNGQRGDETTAEERFEDELFVDEIFSKIEELLK